ncbi:MULTISPECIES: hypothetical protein [unclassified Streptomyces]|uniref:hypothetical protein n=1 Tax=unclassified Streptomyces TaxID=2593676 RepID=UPI001BB048C6|nr:hypothetical protein [Streptomyces sp. A2-16]QUC62129.1 hypothetical protein IOD14_38150 [Streptomyces sp. A2-16]
MNRTSLARTAAVAATVLITAACGTAAGSSGHGPSAPSAPTTAAAPARVTHALPKDPVRMVLPVTGAESRWTQGLDVLGQQVARTAAADCARTEGIRLPEEAPLAFISYAELPDLDFLGRHGFGHGTEVPPPAPAPTSATGTAPARSGSAAQTRRCRAEGEAAAQAVRKVYLPLQRAWFGELSAARRAPKATRALDDLPGCLAERGYRVRDENAFFALVDSRLMNAPAADYARVDSALGSAYATCMGPVEAAREPVRREARERFLREHAEEIRSLRAALVPALRRAEQAYGLRLAFPTP